MLWRQDFLCETEQPAVKDNVKGVFLRRQEKRVCQKKDKGNYA